VTIPTAAEAAIERRWTTYRVVHGRTTESWVGSHELERIEAGFELRILKTRDGFFHQYLKVAS
jgi:hypothetical protein